MARSPRPLEGRTALVTGGAKRVGAAIVRRLAAAGAAVAVHHNQSAREAERLVRELRGEDVKAVALAGDLGDGAVRARLVPEAAKALGSPLDILVNNASIFPTRTLGQLDLEHVQNNVAVNAWAPFELTRAVAQGLPATRSAAVVNLLDARIVDEDRRHVGYHLAKRMLADLTRLSALEFAPRVTVNAVAPGPTLPPPGTEPGEGAELMERLRQRLPLARTPEPDDLAQGVVYLVTARAVTGQILYVDGGRHLGRPEETARPARKGR